MNAIRPELPRLSIRKHDVTNQLKSPPLNSPTAGSSGGGALSPDLSCQNGGQLLFPIPEGPQLQRIGPYLLQPVVQETHNSSLVEVLQAKNVHTGQEYTCKVIPVQRYRETLSAYFRLGSSAHVTQISEVVLGANKAYVFFERHFGDLHSYVRGKRRLREPEAVRILSQVARTVAHAHRNGVILRDLKLRKFVFSNPERTELKLEGLEDAVVLEDECASDVLEDKHGCPAYVAPEILCALNGYSGRAADLWSLGVMAFTLLVGRYPFHDTDAGALFSKIRRGQFAVPDAVSSRGKCLIRSLLRKEPDERLSATEMLAHPFFKPRAKIAHKKDQDGDQQVPVDAERDEEMDEFFS